MNIKVYEIPLNYRIKLWGDIDNRARWYRSPQGAYLDRRIILKYNPGLDPEAILVYQDSFRVANAFTLLERIG